MRPRIQTLRRAALPGYRSRLGVLSSLRLVLQDKMAFPAVSSPNGNLKGNRTEYRLVPSFQRPLGENPSRHLDVPFIPVNTVPRSNRSDWQDMKRAVSPVMYKVGKAPKAWICTHFSDHLRFSL